MGKKEKEIGQAGSRYDLLDTIRGTVLVSMVVYHLCWNFVYIYRMPWEWYKSQAAFFWQQSICWTFILLSGFCFSLGKHPLRNGLAAEAGGGLVTLTTLLFLPSNRVIFGVLTCIGSCILFLYLTERFWKKIPCRNGAVISFFLFLLTKNINQGYLGLGGMKIAEIPANLYRNYMTAFLGLPFREFYSTDYFSLFPWLFLFLTGFYLYHVFEKMGWMKRSFMKIRIAPLACLGRHSLIIYLLHQPVIFGLQEIFCKSLLR